MSDQIQSQNLCEILLSTSKQHPLTWKGFLFSKRDYFSLFKQFYFSSKAFLLKFLFFLHSLFFPISDQKKDFFLTPDFPYFYAISLTILTILTIILFYTLILFLKASQASFHENSETYFFTINSSGYSSVNSSVNPKNHELFVMISSLILTFSIISIQLLKSTILLFSDYERFMFSSIFCNLPLNLYTFLVLDFFLLIFILIFLIFQFFNLYENSFFKFKTIFSVLVVLVIVFVIPFFIIFNSFELNTQIPFINFRLSIFLMLLTLILNYIIMIKKGVISNTRRLYKI